jgi:saccharopine dehydrogenase-like NADP-dependent oxidoreductase
MKKISVLGSGMMGSAIAIDLSKNYNVEVLDLKKNEEIISVFKEHKIKSIQADVSDLKILKPLIKNSDLVIGAVPGFIGFNVLKNVIECGKNIVDISFLNEDPFRLNEEAEKRNLTAVVDCGVSPGLSNMILGYHTGKMEVDYYECYVGGLPSKRILPFEYNAPFSPIDVIEEYIRPARLVENGKIVTKPPLSDLENIDIDPVGILESFNTDGLRTLLKTMQVPNMKEKTLRYPGHIKKIKFLKECGFFNTEFIEINGASIRPVDLTAKLLLPIWNASKNQDEFTVMKIIIKGKQNGKRKEHIFILYDKFDESTKTTSMARTTGYTCSGAARLILEGKFNKIGICPPENIGIQKDCFNEIITYLESRKITLKHIERNI